ncbi:hypothetical protein [Kitasatospora sp. NBC_00315]|uniref:hypothetical protein n=1 Tax=Kitasatospora sp. NBC_00315 TaxID=2975963 RepID=UPI0032525A73
MAWTLAVAATGPAVEGEPELRVRESTTTGVVAAWDWTAQVVAPAATAAVAIPATAHFQETGLVRRCFA